MTPRITYATIYVTDLAKSLAFYCDTIGLPLLYSDEAFGYARLDGGGVGLGIAAVAENVPNRTDLVGRHTGVSIAFADIDAAYETLQAKGVRFPMKLEQMPWGRKLAEFADPDNNVLFLDSIE